MVIMIPTTKSYATSKVTPAHSRAEVEDLLSKFKIAKTMWKRDDPEVSYFVFEKPVDGVEMKPVAYKVSVPFIEKQDKRSGVVDYDEIRAYRFFYHIFKAAMLNFEIGMGFEQVFGNYMVVGSLADGTPISIQDKIHKLIMIDNKQPALEFK